MSNLWLTLFLLVFDIESFCVLGDPYTERDHEARKEHEKMDQFVKQEKERFRAMGEDEFKTFWEDFVNEDVGEPDAIDSTPRDVDKIVEPAIDRR